MNIDLKQVFANANEILAPTEEAKDAGATKSRHFSVIDGEVVEYRQEKYGGARWPRASDALGVHPSQIDEFRQEAKRNGCDIDFNSQGQCIIPDAQTQRRYLKVRGMVNFDSYD